MNSSASPSSRCRSCSRLTICALTETFERRHRLVADDQVRLGGEGAGDADALALPAGELVRPAVERVARQPHHVHQPRHPLLQIGARFGEAEVAHRLGQDVAHLEAGVQTGERVLEHHLHAPPQRPERADREIVDALAVEHHLAGRRVEQTQDAAPDGGLAAAGLAHQRQRLALGDGERHAVHGMYRGDPRAEHARAHHEVLLEVVHLQESRVHAEASLGAKWQAAR